MRHALIPIALIALVACAATPKQRELQYITAMTDAAKTTTAALDVGAISADTGAQISAILKVARNDLKRAVADRRAGKPEAQWGRVLSIVQDALTQVAVLLAQEE